MANYRMKLIDRDNDGREWTEDVEGHTIVVAVLDESREVVWQKPVRQWSGYDEVG